MAEYTKLSCSQIDDTRSGAFLMAGFRYRAFCKQKRADL